MEITLTLDQEQIDAITAKNAEHNAASGTELTDEQFIESLIMAEVSRLVRSKYDEALRELGQAAAQMPYENRVALMEQVRQAIQP